MKQFLAERRIPLRSIIVIAIGLTLVTLYVVGVAPLSVGILGLGIGFIAMALRYQYARQNPRPPER